MRLVGKNQHIFVYVFIFMVKVSLCLSSVAACFRTKSIFHLRAYFSVFVQRNQFLEAESVQMEKERSQIRSDMMFYSSSLSVGSVGLMNSFSLKA